MTHSFDFRSRTRLISEPGGVARLGEWAAALGGKRVLLVTDPHIVAAGHCARGENALRGAGLEVFRFEDVHENPTSADVQRCAVFAADHAVDLVVGFGGGSCLDTAKGCCFLLAGGGRMEDYQGYGKVAAPMLPLIAVPTTAGTGSECQSYALIAREDTHQKMACGDSKAAPALALLDPELTLTQPRQVTVATGLDAVTHALECAVTRAANPVSLLFAREAFRLLHTHFATVLDQPHDVAARAAMQLGAAYAGMAIENSMLGAAHSAANPLSAHYDVTHGQAVAVMLPHVMAFNGADPAVRAGYRALAAHAGLVGPDDSDDVAMARLLAAVDGLLEAAAFARNLADHGLTRVDIPVLAAEAAGQWTAQFNPRPIAAADFAQLYTEALEGRRPGIDASMAAHDLT